MQKTLVDTNILVRLLTVDDIDLARKAMGNLEGKTGLISSIVLAEAIFVLTSSYGYKKSQIIKLKDFLSVIDFEVEDKEINLKALEIFCKSNLHYVDAWLVAKSRQEGLKLTTFDKDLLKFID